MTYVADTHHKMHTKLCTYVHTKVAQAHDEMQVLAQVWLPLSLTTSAIAEDVCVTERAGHWCLSSSGGNEQWSASLSDSGNIETTSPLSLQVCTVIQSNTFPNAWCTHRGSWELAKDSQVGEFVAHVKVSYMGR